jgi:methylmalonyl-CoA mutase cobalamin-binding subunit
MATIALREDRWDVDHLGSGVPAVDLARFVEAGDAELVVLSVTMWEHLDRTKALARDLEGVGVATLVGGPGRTLDELCRLAAEAVS